MFGLLALATLFLLAWSVRSLPPADRGQRLVVEEAFRYFRHPLYAAFLTFFNFGLAVLLNSWLYVVWAVVLHPLWHLNVRGEERGSDRLDGEPWNDCVEDSKAKHETMTWASQNAAVTPPVHHRFERPLRTLRPRNSRLNYAQNFRELVATTVVGGRH